MTSEILLNKNLLLDNIKRHKVLIIVTGILMFLACPFMEILTHMGRREVSFQAYYTGFYENAADGMLRNAVFGFMLTVSIALGLFLALSVMRYMHDRKASVFFNSIPIRKRTLYLTQVLSGLIYFTAPLAIIYFISVLILPSYVTFVMLTKIFLISWVVFLLVYSFVIMCANIAGTVFNSVISAGYLSLVTVACFGCVVGFIETFYRFTSILPNSNMPEEVLLPVIYFIAKITETWYSWKYDFINSTLLYMLFAFLVSAVFLFIGLLLNKINKTENAEKSFYFKISQTIFKYTLLSMVVILSGIMFYQAFRQSFVYLILGAGIGGFIALLFINFIIYKNIREVFSGLKRFGIFVAAASVVLIAFSFDIFGIDKHIPEASKIESIELNRKWRNNMFNYTTYVSTDTNRLYNEENTHNKIKDPATIELVNNVLKAAMKSNPSSSYSASYSNHDTIIMDGIFIRYNLKSGLPVNKKIPYSLYFYSNSDKNDYLNAADLLLGSRGFRETYFAPFSDKDFMSNLINAPEASFEIRVNSWRYGYSSYSHDINKFEVAELASILNSDIFSDDFKMNLSYDCEINITVIHKLNDGAYKHHDFVFELNDSFVNTIEYVEKNLPMPDYDEEYHYNY